jgi:hypothetical protein
MKRKRKLLHIASADCGPASLFGASQRGQQQSCQNRDGGEYDS